MDDIQKKNIGDVIQLTKDEIITLINDVEDGTGCWSDSSYKIIEFIGQDPSEGT